MGIQKSEVLIRPDEVSKAKHCLGTSPYNDCLLKAKHINRYITPMSDPHLKTDNFLKEYDTPYEKFKVRNNLGIEGLAYWGNIQGKIEDLKDLVESSKIIEYIEKNLDFHLNDSYKEAIRYLNIGKIQSIDDAIAVIMHSLFPIEYKQWTIEHSGNISKTYEFEKGTTLELNENDVIGSINITAVCGNLEDEVILSKDSNPIGDYKSDTFSNNFPITVSDITDEFVLNDAVTKIKTYEFKITSLGNEKYNHPEYSKTCSVLVLLKANPILYYFYFTSDTELDQTTFNEAEISDLKSKTTRNTYLYELGDNSKYLYILSPTNPSLILTAAGTSKNAADKNSYSVSTGWISTPVTYTPDEGTAVSYYLIHLLDKQKQFVKINVT